MPKEYNVALFPGASPTQTPSKEKRGSRLQLHKATRETAAQVGDSLTLRC